MISRDITIEHPVDVCIVGSGPCGAALASALGGTDLSVVVLEGSSGTLDRLSADQHDFYGLENQAAQSFYDGAVEGLLAQADPAFLTRSRLRMLGGTLRRWGGWCRELDRSDFQPRSGWGDGWPMRYETMRPYYARAWQTLAGIDAPAEDSQHAPPMLRSGTFQIVDRPYGAFDRTFLRALAESKNVAVMTDAHATGLTTVDSQDLIRSLTYVKRDGSGQERELRIFARVFVLAMGGLEATRFLLLCRRQGLRLESPALARHFALHPVIPVAARVHLSSEPAPDFRRAFLNRTAVGRVGPEGAAANGVREIKALMPSETLLARETIGNFRALFFEADEPGVVNINISWEQRPHSPWSLCLDERDLDALGQPRLRATWGLDATDAATVDAALGEVRSSLDKLLPGKFERLLEYPIVRWPISAGFIGVKPGDHPMGTLRMSGSADDGVVDSDSRVHGFRNLFVLGSATFPAGGVANPTLSCVALSMKLADLLSSEGPVG